MQMKNHPKEEKLKNIDSIDLFLKKELSNAHSDSAKMFVYQRAFDYLINEFQICRPLLSRIKKQYDMIGNELVSRKRELTLNSSPESQAEDAFPEAINELRKVRTQEFAQKKTESEILLDKMTKLRLRRSELLKQFDNLSKKESDLSNTESDAADKIIELNSQIHDMIDFVKSTDSSSALKKKQIEELHEEILKTQQSTDELKNKDKNFQSQILILEKEVSEFESSIDRFKFENSELSEEINDLTNSIETLNKKKLDAKDKLSFVETSYQNIQEKLRNVIKEKELDIDLDLPVDKILNEIQALLI